MLLFKEILKGGLTAGQVPARTKSAREWYRNAAGQVLDGARGLSPKTAEKHWEPKRKVGQMEPGMMYMFRYDPKHKKTLPYYDTFPVIFPIDIDTDSFLGINFHYLPPVSRAKLMNALYTVTTDKRFDEKTKIVATYQILSAASKFKLFKPTVKRYLKEHVRSPYLEITAKEWDIAIFLPTENFKKASAQDVWVDSLLKVN
jgi:hypothetical protein